MKIRSDSPWRGWGEEWYDKQCMNKTILFDYFYDWYILISLQNMNIMVWIFSLEQGIIWINILIDVGTESRKCQEQTKYQKFSIYIVPKVYEKHLQFWVLHNNLPIKKKLCTIWGHL